MKINKICLGSEGFTLIELLLTIVIVSVILMTSTMMLVTLVKTARSVDTRRIVRQDIEQSLEVMKRDIRNADPTLSLVACNPSTNYILKDSTAQASSQNSELDLVLASNQAEVKYSVILDNENNSSTLQRKYTSGSSTVISYLTSTEVDIQSLVINCSELIKENKFLLITVVSDSLASDNQGKIVNDTKKITGVTIRNVNSN